MSGYDGVSGELALIEHQMPNDKKSVLFGKTVDTEPLVVLNFNGLIGLVDHTNTAGRKEKALAQKKRGVAQVQCDISDQAQSLPVDQVVVD
jgi:hypothetical protein